ncbi:hypothetical protein [Kutzneria sp. CA-103260]|uniref:hypothetical protein n=1 Tax=Kutzneria sp. CA-103260 TaxID=2802641 RepID=UPI001BA5C97B|nr:hypothetical protein [Kutzneria sp. CA-103260]QUQ65388.1 hypothetical protein JJ691_31110 [Kutzneria sp. CA-103260]
MTTVHEVAVDFGAPEFESPYQFPTRDHDRLLLAMIAGAGTTAVPRPWLAAVSPRHRRPRDAVGWAIRTLVAVREAWLGYLIYQA